MVKKDSQKADRPKKPLHFGQMRTRISDDGLERHFKRINPTGLGPEPYAVTRNGGAEPMVDTEFLRGPFCAWVLTNHSLTALELKEACRGRTI